MILTDAHIRQFYEADWMAMTSTFCRKETEDTSTDSDMFCFL